MTPLQFALELETIIANQLKNLAETTAAEYPKLLTLLCNFQTEFRHILTRAQAVDIDKDPYPPVIEHQLLGSDTSWQQATQELATTNLCLDELTTYWSLYTILDKSAQFYQQAATNSTHPQTRLFFSSLCHIKKILHRRLNGVIHIYHNHLWEKLGFAPFILGKD